MKHLPSFHVLLFWWGSIVGGAGVEAEVGSMVSKVRLFGTSAGVKPI